MGRIAGTVAGETRERLLRAAADVFAARGYDGTRVSDIAAQAGLSNGALYNHFTDKAELLVGAVRAHGRRLLAELVAVDPGRSIPDLLLAAGQALPRRRDPDTALVVEAVVAARRDPDVAGPIRDHLRERADWLAELVREAQLRGEVDPGLPAAAVAHFCLSLAVGTALVPPELHDVDDQDWAALLARLVACLAPGDIREQRGNRP